MKVKDIANQYGFDQDAFENWLRLSSNIPYKSGIMGGFSIDDDTHVDVAVNEFQSYMVDQKALIASKEEERARLEREKELDNQRKQQALAGMLVTSGFNFDGYRISRYSGYISGDDAIQIDRGSQGLFSSVTDVGSSLMSSLAIIRRNALAELKEAAYNLGCNAVIGVDFDYINLDPETANAGGGTLYLPYVFGVTANGNAVVIEKAQDSLGLR